MKKIDFEALFQASPYPYLVMDTDLTVLEANKAYLQSTGADRASIVGKYAFDAFPENPNDPESTNIPLVKASLEKAIATGLPDTTAFLRYSVPTTKDGQPAFEEKYWSATSTPVFGPDGKVVMVVQHPIDVTDLYSFNKKDKVASVDSKVKAEQGADNFNRAQLHEAMLRILNDELGQMRSLFDQAPGFVAVLSGPNHVFKLANEAYFQLVGHRDILDKPVWEALPDIKGQGFEELLDSVYRTGKVWVGRSVPVTVQREANGPLVSRFVDLLYQPIFNDDGSVSGIFAQGHDVTEAYEAQEAHRETEERLREGMMAAKMVVWDWDFAEESAVFSENATAIFGGMPHTLIEFVGFFHPEDQAMIDEAISRAVSGGNPLSETLRLLRRDNGEEIWIDVGARVRLNQDGQAFALRGVALDVTERIQATESLRLAGRQKDEFLAMLAHELRNPLAPISAAAQLLTTDQPELGQLKKISSIIERQVKHLVGLVDDLLDVSRVTRGQISIQRSVVDLKGVVSEAIEQSNPVIQSRSHHIDCQLPGDSVYISGDQTRMVQVLANLIINAAKYTPNGGNIAIELTADEKRACLSVEDDGIGIAPELLPHVFELFTQAERSIDRTQGGLGIGLALVKSLVEIHGGTVKALSDRSKPGSRFEICLPRIEAQLPAGANRSNGAGIMERVLLVDDNKDAADTLALLLEASGHKVAVEYTAKDALRRATRESYDVFLLDIGLPETDGLALVKHLRAEAVSKTAYMVAISGYGAEEHRLAASEAGFDQYLVKPISFVALEHLISEKPSAELV